MQQCTRGKPCSARHEWMAASGVCQLLRGLAAAGMLNTEGRTDQQRSSSFSLLSPKLVCAMLRSQAQ